MLSSFVEHGHDDGDASCLAADRADGALEVRVVIVGAHHIVLAVHLIGQTVVEHIADDEDIVAATTEYGVKIHAAVEKDNIFACQFHPEKSSTVGLQIL